MSTFFAVYVIACLFCLLLSMLILCTHLRVKGFKKLFWTVMVVLFGGPFLLLFLVIKIKLGKLQTVKLV